VDRIREMVRNEYAVGVKNVTLNEPFFQGHFPHYRVMPGVLIIEAMAQVGGILVCYSDTVAATKLPLFTGIDRGKFRRQVVPGDQLLMRLEVMRRRGPVWRVWGRAFVEEALAAEAELQVFLAEYPQKRQQQ
jgi:beta-hydroxyacyl-ACP dehydratase FabZ